MGVLRGAFAAHDAQPDRLSDIIADLGPGHLGKPRVAVASAASQPLHQLVVDEYFRASDGAYRLSRHSAAGTDLFR